MKRPPRKSALNHALVALARNSIGASVCAWALACGAHGRAGSDEASVIGASSKRGEAVAFRFDSLDSREVGSEAFRRKPTVLAFVTTWDLSSQAQVDFLVPMQAHDGKAVNYALIALQEPKDRELVEAYRAGLHVDFPVALADDATIRGGGPFGDVHSVPTVIVLDERGRVVWRHVGLAKSSEIRLALHDFAGAAVTPSAVKLEDWNTR